MLIQDELEFELSYEICFQDWLIKSSGELELKLKLELVENAI